MALTEITGIHLNKEDYSRYDPNASIIKARVTFTPDTGLAGEVLRVRLYRYGGWLIATKTAVLAGVYPKGVLVEFDLNGSEAYIFPDSSEPGKRIHNIHVGEYYLVADEELGSASLQTNKFWVLPATRDFLLSTFHFGQTMLAAEVLAAVEQPKNVTGVQVVGTSEYTSKGLHKIIYDNSAKTLTLDSTPVGGGQGDPVTIVPGRREYIITDTTVASGEEYLRLDVDYFELPDSDQQDDVFIDNMTMPTSSLRYFMLSGYRWVWRDLGFPSEPHIITTMAVEGEEYDRLVEPAALENRSQAVWQNFKLPYRRIQHMFYLKGKFNEGEVISIPDEWRIVASRSGQIELVPRNASMIPFVSSGLGIWASRLPYVPEFWHFRAIQGLPDMLNENGPALDAILHRAAIETFITSGSAYRAGFSSESISRDGISNSASYTSSAMYGVYSADIIEHQKWLDDHWTKNFKRKLVGIRMVVL